MTEIATDTKSLGIVFVSRSLKAGGAERQLMNLASGLSEAGHSVTIISNEIDGAFIEEWGATEVSFVMNQYFSSHKWIRYFRLIQLIRTHASRGDTDIVYSFLPLANMLSALATIGVSVKLAWGIRGVRQKSVIQEIRLRNGTAMQAVAFMAEQLLARLPDVVITNSFAARERLEAIRFPAKRLEVVPNGIDTIKYRPDHRIRTEMRHSLNLKENVIVIGIASKLAVHKGFEVLLAALADLRSRGGEFKVLVIGGPIEGEYGQSLKRMADGLGLASEVTWLGSRRDVERVLNAIDIYVSSSSTEGFSNSIAEAMAMRCFCVVTDVGDSRRIVGEYGIVIPPDDHHLLADGIASAIDSLATYDRDAARRRIVKEFSIQNLIISTEAVLKSSLRSGSG